MYTARYSSLILAIECKHAITVENYLHSYLYIHLITKAINIATLIAYIKLLNTCNQLANCFPMELFVLESLETYVAT